MTNELTFRKVKVSDKGMGYSEEFVNRLSQEELRKLVERTTNEMDDGS